MAPMSATQEKDLTPPYTTRELLRDLWVFLAPYKGKFFFYSVLRFFGDIAGLYPAYALAFIVNFFVSYQVGASLYPVWVVLGLFALASFFQQFGQYLSWRMIASVAERVSLDARLRGLEKTLLLDMEWQEKENTGNKLKKIERGGESMNNIIRLWVNSILGIFVNLFGMIFIISVFDRTIAILIAIYLAGYIFVSRIFISRHAESVREVNIAEEQVHGILFETLNNIRSVKISSLTLPLLGIVRREFALLYEKISRRIFWGVTGVFSRGVMDTLFRVGMAVFIVWGIANGKYEVGFFILFHMYFGRLAESAREIANAAETFLTAKLGISRLMDILHEPVEIDNEEGKVAFPKEWKKISLKNVSFAYGEKGENEVLSGVSFDINRGERVGIVGLSGAGKSTLFKLLLKEREQSAGEILIDDVPLKTISKEDYFRHTAAVLQETEVFNFTLKQNVVLANSDQAENSALFDRSLQIAHVSDFLSKLPLGAETLIGEKGVKLSGGEKQRLGLARAVFKQPEILLLDEATSHLDVESEEKIRASLHEFFQSVTALVIAHRLTTVREMDRIIVIEDGKILEEGSFENLYEKRGRFFELWEKQKL